MANNWTDWYSGAMAPPLKVPGGYIPAPSLPAPMSVEEMYQGIIPSAPTGLTSRSVNTVPIVPTAPITADASARGGLGTGMQGRASLPYTAPALPNQPSGSISVGKSQDRLPQTTRDADILTGYAPLPGNSATSAIDQMLVAGGGYGKAGTSGRGSGSLSLPGVPKLPSAPVHQLNIDPPADEGQMYADSMGIPVRSKSGKVYSPKVPGSAVMPSGKVAPRYGGPKAAPAANSQRGGLFGLGGGGGLLGLMFGGGGGLFGGNRAGATGVGLLPGVGAAQAASKPGPTYTTTPFQEDRFQTTTGAQMPSSMANSRWTTGY